MFICDQILISRIQNTHSKLIAKVAGGKEMMFALVSLHIQYVTFLVRDYACAMCSKYLKQNSLTC